MKWEKFNRFMTGNDDPWSLNFKELFSQTFKKHAGGEAPASDGVSGMPKPWVWFRVFLFLSILSVVYYLITVNGGIYLAFPWLALMAASVIPVSVMVFLYETVRQEKIRLMDAVVVFFVGTAGSFMAVVFLDADLGFEILNGILIAPIIEEAAKILCIYLVLNFLKIKRVSTALFFGWVVGSGFEIAETLGYSTYFGFQGIFLEIEFVNAEEYIFVGDLDFSVMLLRSLSAFGSHALFGAMEAAGILFAHGKNKSDHASGRFWIWAGLAVAFHMIWNANAYWSAVEVDAFSFIYQLLMVPVLLYLLDAGIRDQKAFLRSLPPPESVTESPLPEVSESGNLKIPVEPSAEEPMAGEGPIGEETEPVSKKPPEK